MKVLLATDFFESSVTARSLLGHPHLRWPTGSQVEALHVLRPGRSGLFGAIRGRSDEDVSAAKKAVWSFASVLGGQLVAKGVRVCGSLRVGDPAAVIVERAEEVGADLIVLGDDGRSRLGRHLGSISTTVVDHARCSVLVARRPNVRRVVFADDGSSSADHAAEALRDLKAFDQLPLSVTSVADWRIAARDRPFPGREVGVLEQCREIEALRALATRKATTVVDRRVAEFRAGGRTATATVREGDATEQLLASGDGAADMLVLGTSEQTALGRLILGSVGHDVLFGFGGSVLVARSSHRIVIRMQPKESTDYAAPGAMNR